MHFPTINLGSKLISSRFAKFAYLPALGTVFVFQFPLSGRLHTSHLDTVFVFSHPSVPIAHFLPCHRCVFLSLQHLASSMLAALGTDLFHILPRLKLERIGAQRA